MREFNKIFGIGFPRTGTCSLAAGLYELGIPCVHYPTDEELFKEYRAFCDMSIAFAYKELDKEYPGSLFIFTERNDFKKFHESLCKIFPNFYQAPGVIFAEGKHTQEGVKAAYDKHRTEVIEHFKDRPNDLLFLNIVETEDPYKPLCEFLNIADFLYPDKKFPNLNSGFIANRVHNILIREDGFVKHLRVNHPSGQRPKEAKYKPTEEQIKEYMKTRKEKVE